MLAATKFSFAIQRMHIWDLISKTHFHWISSRLLILLVESKSIYVVLLDNNNDTITKTMGRQDTNADFKASSQTGFP